MNDTLYFLFVGWWLGLLWGTAGILIACTIILWPVGAAMVFKTPEIMFGKP